nr:hypothetical protein [Tanacetum cinerariifolium]
MRTRSSSNLVGESSPNPTTSNSKRRNRRRSKQPFILEQSPVDTMADQRAMAELLRAPTEGYAEAIVVSPILAEYFELKHTHRWIKKEPHHSILTWEDLVSKFINEFFLPSRTTNLRNEISNFQQRFDESFHEAWDRYKDLLRACPHHGFTKLHQLDTFYNALNPADQDSLNSAAGGNLLERRTQDVLTIIKNKSKVRNSRNKSIVSQVKSSDANSSSSSEIAKLTHAVNQQTSVVTTAMTTILKQFQATPPSDSLKAIEEICVTCGGAHLYYQCLAVDGNTFSEFRDNIQGYVSAAAVNYSQGNYGYRPPSVANQIRQSSFDQPNMLNIQNRFSQPQGYNRGNNFNQDTSYQALIQQNQVIPLSELEKIKMMNEINIKAMQTKINNVKIELRNEMKTSIQDSMSNQTNELKNMMASFFQMNTASTTGSGPLPSNTIANPRGKLKAITTQSGLVLNGPSVPMPLPFINPEEDKHAEETLTDPKLAEYTIKVPPTLVQKAKLPSLRNYVMHQRDPRHPHIPYPLRMNQEKQQEKAEVQIHKFWQLFKQLHINITLAYALILIPKYQKMLKVLLANKEKLLELENTPFNENCSAVILKKLPVNLGDPGKFLIPCGFSELKCKALADLGASINLMPLSIWKNLGLPELISTRMTFELANRSDPRVPLILGRPFLPTARALIDVHGEEMILRDCNERLTLNMRHDTSSYSNQPHKESINMINIYNDSYEDYLEDLFATNHLSCNSTFSSHTDLTSPDKIEYLLNHDPTKEMDSILEDSVDDDNLVDPNNDLINTISEMFTNEHTLDYSSSQLYDDVDDDLVELESDYEYVYDDPFDSKEDKIKESKLLIDELDPPRSSDFLPSPKCESILYEDFSRLMFCLQPITRTNYLIRVYPFMRTFMNTNRVAPDKNVKKISSSNASLILEDFNPHLYELPFHKEVPGSKTPLSFSFENEKNVFNPGILTSKRVHTSLLLELSYRGPKAFKVIKIFECPMEIFPCSYGEDIRILDVPCLHF